MPKLLFARPPIDAAEERTIRKLAGARHAPADWIRRAQIIALSWDGLRVPAIAQTLGCSQKAVRYRLARFAADGLDGLGDRPGAGRKPRIGQDQRSQRIALVASPPPGRLVRDGAGALVAGDAAGAAVWTLDALTARPGGRHRHPPVPGAPDPAGRRECPGVDPPRGPPAPIRNSAQENASRGLLHPPADVHHGHRGRPARPGDISRLGRLCQRVHPSGGHRHGGGEQGSTRSSSSPGGPGATTASASAFKSSS